MSSPIVSLIDAAVRCLTCGKGMKECQCYRRCRESLPNGEQCHWLRPTDHHPAGAEAGCGNPAHGEPPRDVACPHCGAKPRERCHTKPEPPRWPTGAPMGYHHARRIRASERAR